MFLHNFCVFVDKTERFIYENQSKTYCSKTAVTPKQIIRKNRSIQPTKKYICKSRKFSKLSIGGNQNRKIII